MFQLALPRRERQPKPVTLTSVSVVSTRAPAKGATLFLPITTSGVIVSTRAPAKGATISKTLSGKQVTLFQLALPRRERPKACDCD